MECVTSLIRNRVYVDNWFLRLHRKHTVIVLLLAAVITAACVLISLEICYVSLENSVFCKNNNQRDGRLLPFLYAFEAIITYLPFCVFYIGADKHPYGFLETVQRSLSLGRVSEDGHLSTIMECLDGFLIAYRKSAQQKKRFYFMASLLYQELLQFAVFVLNFSLISHSFSSHTSTFKAKSEPMRFVLFLVWMWHFIVFLITVFHFTLRIKVFYNHKDKILNRFYWGLEDDTSLDFVGRMLYADWVFFDYVRQTTDGNFHKYALMRLAEEEGGTEGLSLNVV